MFTPKSLEPVNVTFLQMWLIKYRILKWNHPGLSRWALSSMSSVLIWDTWRRKHREGDVRMEAEIGIMWPQAKERKECLAPPEAGRHKEQNLPPRTTGGNIALLTSWFWTSSLQNCEETNFWYVKPPRLGTVYNSVRKLMQHTILKYSPCGLWRQRLLTLALESSF